MEEYRREVTGAVLPRPPGAALPAGAGLEFFSLPTHLSLTAPPYVAIGNYLRQKRDRARRLLDLGCGCARGAFYLKKYSPPGTSVTGVDRVYPLIRSAATNLRRPGLNFITASAVILPFPEGVFDLVFSVFSLIHHLRRSELENVFKEAARVLKPGGLFIFTTPNRKLSQDLYHPNPNDDAGLRFSALNRREFGPKELQSFLDGRLAGPDKLFAEFFLVGLINPAFRPAWEKTIREMGKQRFSGGRLTAGAALLVRYFLPASFRTRCFLNRLNKNAVKMKISPRDIAAAAAFRPVENWTDVLHFLVVMRKEE